MKLLRRGVVPLVCTLAGCDHAFGLTGEHHVDAAPPLEDAVPPADSDNAGCGFTGNPQPVVELAQWTVDEAQAAALGTTSAGEVLYAAAAAGHVANLGVTYRQALAATDLHLLRAVAISADGASFVAIRTDGTPRFVTASKSASTTPPFIPARTLHLIAGSERTATAEDRLSALTRTTPRRMIVRGNAARIEEYVDSDVDTMTLERTTPAASLGLERIDTATLSPDGLALTLVGTIPGVQMPRVLRSTRPAVGTAFGLAGEIYLTADELTGASATGDCASLFIEVNGSTFVLR